MKVQCSKKFFSIVLIVSFLGVGFLMVTLMQDFGSVRVVFLDVGQGDAILISRGSNQFLIDTGKNGRSLLAELGRHIPFWDRTIETVLLTHPDQDHIGALPDVFNRYRVSIILSADVPSETKLGRIVGDSIRESGAEVIDPRTGLSVEFSPHVDLEVLFPPEDMMLSPKSTNAGSVVTRLRAGADTFLFTGDLTREEVFIPLEDIRVLKVAHHGSRHSTSDTFLDRMTPEEAVISVGKNSYGHPAPEVLERFEYRGIRTLRTDTSGSIVYTCPGVPETHCNLVTPKL